MCPTCGVPTACLLALAGFAVAACTQAPVAEIRQFCTAIDAVDTASQPLLDDLALAERQQGREIAVRRARGLSNVGADVCPPGRVSWQLAPDGQAGFIRGFCDADIAYYSELSDPPATAAFRRGLAVIEEYGDVLVSLAEGRNVGESMGQLDALAQNVTGLLALIPGAGQAALALRAPLAELQPIVEAAARSSTSKEALRLIKSGAPAVGRLIDALQAASGPIFNTLIEAPAARLSLLDPSEVTAATEELRRIEGYRVLVANYAVLLGELRKAWDATVIAADRPPSPVTLERLAARSAEIAAQAETVRRTLAAIRTATGPLPAAGTMP